MKPKVLKPPVSKNPSQALLSWLDKVAAVDGVVYDIACGYGRNGAYVLKRGRQVCFVDVNEDLLSSVRNGDLFHFTKEDVSRAQFLAIDLRTEKLTFPSGGIAGVIIVHFYDYETVRSAVEAVKLGGFVFIESISDRGGNYLELPRRGQVCSLLGANYDVLYCQTNPSRKDSSREMVKVFAVRIR